MSSTKRSCVVAALVIAALAGCGGGNAPPASPAQKSAPVYDHDGDGVTDQDAVAPNATGAPETTTVRARARADLDRAERELEASTGDCAAACRALGSMERATRHLCDLVASSPEDAPRCDDAQRKVRAARENVRSTCGVCPGGT
jgi:hypothetical protein